jgi:hypothetical protein
MRERTPSEGRGAVALDERRRPQYTRIAELPEGGVQMWTPL